MSENEVKFENLPWEVIENILTDKNLNTQDILNFGLTCKCLYKATFSSNKIWRRKFFQRWPNFIKLIYEENEKNGQKIVNWMKEYSASIESYRDLIPNLILLSKHHYRKQELSTSTLKNFDPLFQVELGAHPMSYHFLVHQLLTIIHDPAFESNLTVKHYARRVVRYLRQKYLADEWKVFTSLPARQQTLERGAVFVSQWSQPTEVVLHRDVSKMLDSIAECTRENLQQKYPSHTIFSVSPAILQLWKLENIDDNQYDKTETRQIMSALCEVMFDIMKFHGNSEMYYSSVNSFIDQVLIHKRGIPITLAIVFESVARRLGLRCEPVSFPAHFLLRWKEKYNTPEGQEAESFYIDVFNGGQFLTKNSCPRIASVSKCPIEQYNHYQGATAIEVVQRMANNLEVAARQRTQLNGRAARLRSALELIYLVRAWDATTVLHLARFYMLHKIDPSDLIEVLLKMQKSADIALRGQASQILQILGDYTKDMKKLPQETLNPKKRKPEVKFAIGMIMKDPRLGYHAVITGWDYKCEASSEWMDESRIDELPNGFNQPFYNLFVDGGSSRYAAQESIRMAEHPCWIDHDEIGRYFSRFCNTHYLPNNEKEIEYPYDAQIRDQLLAQAF